MNEYTDRYDDYVADAMQHIDGNDPHPDDCECEECRARFDAIMWSWLTPEIERRVMHYIRTGDVPEA